MQLITNLLSLITLFLPSFLFLFAFFMLMCLIVLAKFWCERRASCHQALRESTRLVVTFRSPIKPSELFVINLGGVWGMRCCSPKEDAL